MSQKPEQVILEATLDVIAEKTISYTRMHHIADKTGMVQSNIHYYFKTKVDLFLALQQMLLNHFAEERRELYQDSPDDSKRKLSHLLDQKRNNLKNSPHLEQVQIDFLVHACTDERIEENVSNSYRYWREELKTFIMDLGISDENKAAMLAFTATSLMEGASLQYLVDKDSIDIDAYFNFIQHLILQEIERS